MGGSTDDALLHSSCVTVSTPQTLGPAGHGRWRSPRVNSFWWSAFEAAWNTVHVRSCGFVRIPMCTTIVCKRTKDSDLIVLGHGFKLRALFRLLGLCRTDMLLRTYPVVENHVHGHARPKHRSLACQ